MIPWIDNLLPAFFRGVPFYVERDDLIVGRRVQLHEYPQRDKPYAEDLGRAARKFTITGYVIGPGYMTIRDLLLGALEAPGPGCLVHPHYGPMLVMAKGECKVTHSKDEGGMCRFSMSFVEAKDLELPSATKDIPAILWLRLDALQSLSIGDFSRSFRIFGFPDHVAGSAGQSLTRAVERTYPAVAPYCSGWALLLLRLQERLHALLGDPDAFAIVVMGLFAALGSDAASRAAAQAAGISPADIASVNGAASIGGGVVGGYTTAPIGRGYGAGGTTAPPILAPLARIASYTPATGPVAATALPVTPSRRQQVANSEAMAALFRRAALVQAARTVAAADWPVHDDAIQVRDELAELIDAEAARPGVTDPLFRALTDLRVAVVNGITTRAAGAARLSSVTPTTAQPAVVLAYDLYEDAGRAGEIVTRNRIGHPGFVPVRPLTVLS